VKSNAGTARWAEPLKKANITSRDGSRRRAMSGEKVNRCWKGKFRSERELLECIE